MGRSTEEILQQPAMPPVPGPSREQLETSIKALHNYRTAVAAGTFSGHQSRYIAGLLELLDHEHNAAARLYAERFPAEAPAEVKQ